MFYQIRIKGRANVHNQYVYGLSVAQIANYLAGVLAHINEKKGEKKKFSREDYEKIKFYLKIHSLEPFGKKRYSVEYNLFRSNHRLEKAEENGQGMVDLPKQDVDIAIVLPDSVWADMFGYDVSPETIEKEMKEIKFLGGFPNYVGIQKIKSLRQGGGYVVDEVEFKNEEEFWEKIFQKNVYPNVLGYRAVHYAEGVEMVRKGQKFPAVFIDALIGLVKLKSVYRHKDDEDLKKKLWQYSLKENHVKLTTKKNQKGE